MASALLVFGLQLTAVSAEDAPMPTVEERKHHRCQPGSAITGLWDHCGELPASLPMSFRINAAGAPVPAADLTAAAEGAAGAWRHPILAPQGVFSIAGTTTKTLAADGANTISFGDPAACDTPGVAAVACLWFAGATGDDRHRIVEVDIVLNASEDWRQASGFEEYAGVATGTLATSTQSWLDLQSALTHELGHALGLEHIGNPSAAFAADVTDAGQHLQTMYRWDYRGSTIKRTLDVGDLLGLAYVLDQT